MALNREREATRARISAHFVERAASYNRLLEDPAEAVTAHLQLMRDWPHLHQSLDWASERPHQANRSDGLWRTLVACDILLDRVDARTEERWWTAQLAAALRLGDPLLEAHAKLRLGRALLPQKGEFERGWKLIEEGECIAKRLGDTPLYIRCFLAHHAVRWDREITWSSADHGKMQEILGQIDQLLDAAGGDLSLRAELEMARVVALSYIHDRRPTARSRLEAAAGMLRGAALPLLELRMLVAKLLVLDPSCVTDPSREASSLRETDERELVARELWRRSDQLGYRPGLQASSAMLASVAFERADVEAAARWVERLRSVEGDGVGGAGYWGLACALHEGRFAELAELGNQIASETPRNGFSALRLELSGGAYLYVASYLLGDVAACDWVSQQGLARLPGDPYVAFTAALSSAMQGREAEAVALLKQHRPFSTDETPVIGLSKCWFAAEAASEVRAVGLCAELERVLSPCVGRVITIGLIALCLGSVDRTLGRLIAVQGRHCEAIRRYDAALRIDEKLGARTWSVLTRLDRARSYLARASTGDSQRAHADLRAAAKLAAELGMQRAERQCVELLSNGSDTGES